MAISSIHIEAGKNGYFAHNSRETKTKNSIFSDEDNFSSCSNSKAFEIYKSELETRKVKYQNRTGQKLQKTVITHLSAIVNLNAEHKEKDIKKVCDYLEQTLDTKIIQYAIHRDEGHHLNEATDEVRRLHSLLNEDDKIKNYHAHIEFLGLDSQGNSVRRKLTKRYLSDLQTKTAELLQMERGSYTMLDNPQEFYNQILDEMPKTNNLKDFKNEYIKTGKKIRYRDKPKAKRKSTQHYKDYKEHQADKQILAKQQDLKNEIKNLKAELKEAGASRPDYAKLEQLNRDLKEQIKSKDLTIKELSDSISDYEKYSNRIIDNKKFMEIQLTNARETIFNQKEYISTLETDKSDLEQNMNDLEYKNQELKEKNKQIQIKDGLVNNAINDLELNTSASDGGLVTRFIKAIKLKFDYFKNEIKKLKEYIFNLESENTKLKEKLNISSLKQQVSDSEHSIYADTITQIPTSKLADDYLKNHEKEKKKVDYGYRLS